MIKDEMYNNNDRSDFYKKDRLLEEALTDINNLIEPIKIKNVKKPEEPIVLIMGCARSGSTLLLQYLASLEVFSYPSNLIARFYKNPYLGIRIQQALLEFDPLNQLGFNNTNQNSFSSNLGKTKGALAPSEFWYFWREFFKFSRFNILSDNELQIVNSNEFLEKLSSFERLTDKPLIMKGMMLNWNIPYLHAIYPKFIFIFIKRNILSNAQSLLKARREFFDDITKWYSFKPVEYEILENKSPYEQVIGQVYYTQKAIEKGLEEVPDTNKIIVEYEDFCRNPYDLLKRIQEKYKDLGCNLKIDNDLFTTFVPSASKSINQEEYEKLVEALKIYNEN